MFPTQPTRQTKKELVNYLHMARGSLSELGTQLELARKLGYLIEEAGERLDARMERIDKMLSGAITEDHGFQTQPQTTLLLPALRSQLQAPRSLLSKQTR